MLSSSSGHPDALEQVRLETEQSDGWPGTPPPARRPPTANSALRLVQPSRQREEHELRRRDDGGCLASSRQARCARPLQSAGPKRAACLVVARDSGRGCRREPTQAQSRSSPERRASRCSVTVRVQPPVLPPPADWQFRLDLWQNPWVIAWHYGVQPWSEEHRALLKQHLRLYADAGGKYITTYAVHSPWQDSSYMIEGGMIDWIRRNDGNWAFDYRVFDEYVAMAMDAGVTGAITIYTPVPWGNRFRYWTSAPALWFPPPWPPDSSMFRLVWRAFLDDLKQHLEQRGWLGRTYLGINENPLDQTLAAIKVIKEHSSQWRITYAGDWHPELSGLLDDYSSVYGKEPEAADIRARSVKGLTTTFYVCCTPPKPNTFVFSPPVEGRWLGWYAAARAATMVFCAGRTSAWPADPVRDARHVVWPAGDTFLVYPGGASSVRYAKLREGIVDFEKIRLREEPAPCTSSDGEVKRLMTELERYLASLPAEREFDAASLEQGLSRGQGHPR